MEPKNKKYDWSIVSGGSLDKVDIKHVDIIKNKSTGQLGQYIKTHVAELYDHLCTLLDTEHGGKLRDMMIKICCDYQRKDRYIDEYVIQRPYSKNDFDKFVDKIKKELNKINDDDIHREFYGDADCGSFVRLTKHDDEYQKRYIFFQQNPDFQV